MTLINPCTGVPSQLCSHLKAVAPYAITIGVFSRTFPNITYPLLSALIVNLVSRIAIDLIDFIAKTFNKPSLLDKPRRIALEHHNLYLRIQLITLISALILCPLLPVCALISAGIHGFLAGSSYNIINPVHSQN